MIVLSLLSIPMTLIWLSLTAQYTLEGAVLGYGLSWLILFGVVDRQQVSQQVRLHRLPRQIFWAGVYIVWLLWDTLRSGLDVTRRVLANPLKIDPAMVDVPIQDKNRQASIAALSAHAITLTPGELVVDFIDDNTIMQVHTIDREATTANATSAQTRRLAKIKRILDHD